MKVLKEIFEYRYMIASLVRRELRGRYKGSVLGFLWTFINPMLQFLVYTFVFSIVMRANIEKFYLFLFVAMIPWMFFSTALTDGSFAVLSQSAMVSKIYFPREVLPIAFVTSGFINMLYCFVIVFIVVFISGVNINPVSLLYLPLIMLIEYILALAITFISSSITVYFRDLHHILSTISLLWMYASTLFYEVESVPVKYQKLLMLNPMVPIIAAYRDILYRGRIPEMSTLVHAFVTSAISLLIGILIFEKLKKHFAEEF